MALTNAEKQRRWRDRRNDRAAVLVGKPKEVADGILFELGVDQARKIARALDKRLRNLKPDCSLCHGTGFFAVHYSTACGMPISNGRLPCDCTVETQANGHEAR
jgi:hypothetical protein